MSDTPKEQLKQFLFSSKVVSSTNNKVQIQEERLEVVIPEVLISAYFLINQRANLIKTISLVQMCLCFSFCWQATRFTLGLRHRFSPGTCGRTEAHSKAKKC